LNFPEIVRSYTTPAELGHGRIEKRAIYVLSAKYSKLEFSGIKQIAKLLRYRESKKTGKAQEEVVYLISNLDSSEAPPQKLLELKRDYWSIENKLHYSKDFVFGEDRSTIRAGFGPQNMSALRNLAVSVYQASGVSNIKRFVTNLKHSPVSLLALLGLI